MEKPFKCVNITNYQEIYYMHITERYICLFNPASAISKKVRRHFILFSCPLGEIGKHELSTAELMETFFYPSHIYVLQQRNRQNT